MVLGKGFGVSIRQYLPGSQCCPPPSLAAFPEPAGGSLAAGGQGQTGRRAQRDARLVTGLPKPNCTSLYELGVN